MRGLQRQERTNGKLLGWSKGLHGSINDLMDNKQARLKVGRFLVLITSILIIRHA